MSFVVLLRGALDAPADIIELFRIISFQERTLTLELDAIRLRTGAGVHVTFIEQQTDFDQEHASILANNDVLMILDGTKSMSNGLRARVDLDQFSEMSEYLETGRWSEGD